MSTANVPVTYANSLRKVVSILGLIISGIALSSETSFARGPENTLVVVNANSSDSLATAKRYVDLRDIPTVNVVYLTGITTIKKHGEESSSSTAFKRQILDPMLKAMKKRDIEKTIY